MLKKMALYVPQIKRLVEERNTLQSKLSSIVDRGSPFYNYASTFDAIEVMNRYAVPDLQPSADHLTNFLGVKIAPRFFPGILDGKAGTVEPIPLPANWHADIAEWAAALRSVDLAEETFRVLELGCGWGCWLNNTGAAARGRGLRIELIGIEGDSEHVEFANEAMVTNGFRPDQFRIIHGVAATRTGTALFPKVENAGASWGSEPLFDATDLQVREAMLSGEYQVLPALSLDQIALGEPIDLLHIDIQGGEADYIDSAVADLNRYVRYIVIGTHSRQIEGRLMSTLLSHGWKLEMERPAIIRLVDGKPQISVDGVQGWRSPLR
ncbi:FkbM family methyltransferase [Rhizobium sp. BK060]|uniref:FkbM family methyltransferase n=1 Tax=Rhizobium sp. BK060 TaxID=2587096 RepID=UPI00160A2B8E|nr:FkbM family methyltransferase [Rhizobium sp. BK060]MBB3397904.1 hypothetical protein [Rhizobium sp. BK060]